MVRQSGLGPGSDAVLKPAGRTGAVHDMFFPAGNSSRRTKESTAEMKLRIVVTEGLEELPLAWLKSEVEVIESSWKNPQQLRRDLAHADGLIVRTYTQVNTELLSAGSKLRVVGRAGVGLENIDQEACKQSGVQVISTPGANMHAVCEYVFNLIFHLGRRLVHVPGPISADAFHSYRKTVRGLELHGKTMGILGMGRIGRAVGRVAHAFGMRVIYNDLVDVAVHIDYPATSVPKPEVYAGADILTIHVSHFEGNRNLVGESALQLMRRSAYLINTSRGEVVDAHALAAALRAGTIAGAALDVHEPEPPPADYPLWGMANVILAPHLAARTQGAMDAMSWVARDVVEYLRQLPAK